MTERAHQREHGEHLEKLGAPALLPVRHALLLLDQRGEGLTIAARGIVADDLEAGRLGAPLDPVDMDPPSHAAFMDEAQGFLALLSRIGEGDDDVFREAAAMGVDDRLEHTRAGPASGEADQRGPL